MACSLATYAWADFSGTRHLPRPPYVLLPKHQSMWDIVLEGVLVYRTQGILPHYLMKSTLPDWLGVFGGIHVVRNKDDAQGNERRKNITALRRAKDVLANKGVLVMHPEGTRRKGEVGPLEEAGLAMIVGWQKTLGRIPLVPVGISYGSRTHVRVGAPRAYDSLGARETQELYSDVKRLTGLEARFA
jgi:1-acyl-sn-glycerol-3-phosphate acyltransferase